MEWGVVGLVTAWQGEAGAGVAWVRLGRAWLGRLGRAGWASLDRGVLWRSRVELVIWGRAWCSRIATRIWRDGAGLDRAGRE